MIAPDADLLPKAAALMRREADHHCTELCHAYHGIWGFMRLFECLPAVGRDHDMLLDRIGAVARGGARRVLVSGSADCGLLAYVIEGFRHAGATPEVTVVDACETPLVACRWYGAERGVPVATEARDILTFEGRGFDVVISHNFLNFFTPLARQRLAGVWRDALRPGGQVLCFTSLKPNRKPGERRFDDAKLAGLIDEMCAAHSVSPHKALISREDMAKLVRDYGERRKSNNLNSVSEIWEPLEAAGLHCSDLVAHRQTTDIADSIRDREQIRFCAEAWRPAATARRISEQVALQSETLRPL